MVTSTTPQGHFQSQSASTQHPVAQAALNSNLGFDDGWNDMFFM
ncbi:hypothetical protein [Shewanella sp. S1-49-MNA-CIBAN-0167]